MRYRVIFHKTGSQPTESIRRYATEQQAISVVKNAEIFEKVLYKEYKGGLIEVYDIVSDSSVYIKDI